jgi:hypothetical protein
MPRSRASSSSSSDGDGEFSASSASSASSFPGAGYAQLGSGSDSEDGENGFSAGKAEVDGSPAAGGAGSLTASGGVEFQAFASAADFQTQKPSSASSSAESERLAREAAARFDAAYAAEMGTSEGGFGEPGDGAPSFVPTASDMEAAGAADAGGYSRAPLSAETVADIKEAMTGLKLSAPVPAWVMQLGQQQQKDDTKP